MKSVTFNQGKMGQKEGNYVWNEANVTVNNELV